MQFLCRPEPEMYHKDEIRFMFLIRDLWQPISPEVKTPLWCQLAVNICIRYILNYFDVKGHHLYLVIWMNGKKWLFQKVTQLWTVLSTFVVCNVNGHDKIFDFPWCQACLTESLESLPHSRWPFLLYITPGKLLFWTFRSGAALLIYTLYFRRIPRFILFSYYH